MLCGTLRVTRFDSVVLDVGPGKVRQDSCSVHALEQLEVRIDLAEFVVGRELSHGGRLSSLDPDPIPMYELRTVPFVM